MNLIDCRVEEIISVEYIQHKELGKKICVRFKYSDMGGGGTAHRLFDIGVDWREHIYVGKIISM
jgi:hypothetical protein